MQNYGQSQLPSCTVQIQRKGEEVQTIRDPVELPAGETKAVRYDWTVREGHEALLVLTSAGDLEDRRVLKLPSKALG